MPQSNPHRSGRLLTCTAPAVGAGVVGYIKQHFFVRYRSFTSWAHLNPQAEAWLTTAADPRVQSPVKEVVSVRCAREAPTLQALPAVCYNTAYHALRQVAWDGYIDVRGHRDSVPAALMSRTVLGHIGLDGTLKIYQGETSVAEHRLRPVSQGWVKIPAHHAPLWQETLQVQRRSLAVYQEAATWN